MVTRINDQDKICSFCGNKANYQLLNGNYCCSENHNNCFGYKELLSNKIKEGIKDRYKDSKRNILINELRDGILRCKYCGNKANYIVNYYIGCCVEKSRSCPNFSKWWSEKLKQNYINNPERRETNSKAMKEVQNRPDVKEKKSEKMIILHHNDCCECKEFQSHYNNSVNKRKNDNQEKYLSILSELGYDINIIKSKSNSELKEIMIKLKNRNRLIEELKNLNYKEKELINKSSHVLAMKLFLHNKNNIE